MAKKKEYLIVDSKVKAYIKSKKMMISSDMLVAINDAVYSMLDAAIARTKANRRCTVKPHDFDVELGSVYMRRYCGGKPSTSKTCSALKKSHVEIEHALVSRRQPNEKNTDSPCVEMDGKQYTDEEVIDFVATCLGRDIDCLISLGIKLDGGSLVAKTGGVAWAGYEAFTGDWLSALVIGGISMLAGKFTDGYKRIQLNKMQQKWTGLLSSLSAEELNYLMNGLQRKYPLLVCRFQNLLQSGQ